MAKKVDPEVKEFGRKVGTSAGVSSIPGLLAGQALSGAPELRAAGSIVKPLADIAIHHPYGSGIAGAIATGAAGVIGAIIHQRGIAVGKRTAHMQDAAKNARR